MTCVHVECSPPITTNCSRYFSHLSHPYRPSPLLCGPVFTIIFQYCLFSVMSAVSSYLLISSRLLSIHLRLGRSLLLFPGTTMSTLFLDKLSSSLLLICPYKCNRFCLRNVDIWNILASSCIIFFLTWSFLVLPLIHRSILVSATCYLFSSFSLTAQHSAPCVIVGLITVLYTLSFSLIGTCLWHSTPVSCFHFIHAMSLSAPPFESNIDS